MRPAMTLASMPGNESSVSVGNCSASSAGSSPTYAGSTAFSALALDRSLPASAPNTTPVRDRSNARSP